MNKRKSGNQTPAVSAGETRARLLAEGETPLHILLGNMRYYWQLASKTAEMLAEDGQPHAVHMTYRSLAGTAAEKAAPFLHPKLQSATIDMNAEVTARHYVSAEPLDHAAWTELYGRKDDN